MKKETFVNIMESVLNQLDKEKKLSENISVCFFEPVSLNISESLVSNIIKSLSNEFNDNEDEYGYTIIEWWLYDAPNSGEDKESAWIEYNDKKFTLYDTGELYDFLKYKMNNQ
jgi:hypothetical protein